MRHPNRRRRARQGNSLEEVHGLHLPRYRNSYQPKLGFSAVKAFQSPFCGPESHSRDSRESFCSGRCVKALRSDNGYLRTDGEPGQGRRQSAERTLTRRAVCRSGLKQSEALWRFLVQLSKDSLRPIIERTVKSRVIVMIPPLREFGLRLFHRREPLDVEAFVAESAVEALDEPTLHRPSRTDEAELHTRFYRPHLHGPAGELAAIVQGNAPRRAPRSAIARVGAATTFGPFIERSPSSQMHSRVNLWMTVRMRIARPSDSLSLTKSADQHRFRPAAWVAERAGAAQFSYAQCCEPSGSLRHRVGTRVWR